VARTRVNRLGNRVLGKESAVLQAPDANADADTAAPTTASIDQVYTNISLLFSNCFRLS